jgi:hypothetical protein
MKYWQAKKLKETEFKRLTGVKKNFQSNGSHCQSLSQKKKETWT